MQCCAPRHQGPDPTPQPTPEAAQLPGPEPSSIGTGTFSNPTSHCKPASSAGHQSPQLGQTHSSSTMTNPASHPREITRISTPRLSPAIYIDKIHSTTDIRKLFSTFKTLLNPLDPIPTSIPIYCSYINCSSHTCD